MTFRRFLTYMMRMKDGKSARATLRIERSDFAPVLKAVIQHQ
jgi:hypothetical protein